MTGIDIIKERRSTRKYKPEIVKKEDVIELLEAARHAQSWANYQIARYTIVTNPEKIERLMSDAVKDFVYNVKTLKYAKNVVVLSFVKGKSGKFDVNSSDYVTSKAENVWEVFDAGIACQTFCLAAQSLNIGTCVMGVIDDEKIAEIVELPDNETVAALITFGYPDEVPKITPRKSVDEICRFVE